MRSSQCRMLSIPGCPASLTFTLHAPAAGEDTRDCGHACRSSHTLSISGTSAEGIRKALQGSGGGPLCAAASLSRLACRPSQPTQSWLPLS